MSVTLFRCTRWYLLLRCNVPDTPLKIASLSLLILFLSFVFLYVIFIITSNTFMYRQGLLPSPTRMEALWEHARCITSRHCHQYPAQYLTLRGSSTLNEWVNACENLVLNGISQVQEQRGMEWRTAWDTKYFLHRGSPGSWAGLPTRMATGTKKFIVNRWVKIIGDGKNFCHCKMYLHKFTHFKNLEAHTNSHGLYLAQGLLAYLIMCAR